MNHANRICLDWLGGDSGTAGTVGDQQRAAQWQWLGNQRLVAGGTDLYAAAGADTLGVFWTQGRKPRDACHRARQRLRQDRKRTGAGGRLFAWAGVKPPAIWQWLG